MLAGALPDVRMRAYDVDERPVVVMSDAMWKPRDAGEPHASLGEGHMAFLIWIPMLGGSGKLAFAEAPADVELLQSLADMRVQKTFVCALEAVAMLAAYLVPELEDSLRGRMVIHFADNQAANGVAVKGYSGARDLAKVVRIMQDTWSVLRIDPWVEYVRSAANLADQPSRGELGPLLRMGAVRVPFNVPAL